MSKNYRPGGSRFNSKAWAQKLYDAGIGTAFVGAIAVLLLVAGYVINRLAKERAYREKWKDYNDCGWA